MSRRGAAVCFNGLLGGARNRMPKACASVFRGLVHQSALRAASRTIRLEMQVQEVTKSGRERLV
jgi:hypothetical protein